MQPKKLKNAKWLMLLTFIQVAALLSYLNANIVNVGDMGTAIPMLIIYVGISTLALAFLIMQKSLYVRPHFFFFLLLVSWIAFRVLVDLNSYEDLKQITIGTTGGVLLFYVIGVFLSFTFHNIAINTAKERWAKIIILLFLCFLVWMLYNFSQRLHPRLFYLTGVDGTYQRSGNFLSISFICVSFYYLLLVSKRAVVNAGSLNAFFWLFVYTVSTTMALVGSQLIGSNSATAVILGVYLITLVMTLLIPKKVLWGNYLHKRLLLPWSKRLVKNLVVISILGFFLFFMLLALIIIITGFDITSIRLLGFGAGSNTSLISRVDILMGYGVDQLEYAPFLGDINVAYLTTGNAGRTLHSLLPYVLANLGIVGLGIILLLFSVVFLQLFREAKVTSDHSFACYQQNMIALYSLFILFYLFLFANMATGVSWSVLWFSLGFISRPLGFKSYEKNREYCT